MIQVLSTVVPMFQKMKQPCPIECDMKGVYPFAHGKMLSLNTCVMQDCLDASARKPEESGTMKAVDGALHKTEALHDFSDLFLI